MATNGQGVSFLRGLLQGLKSPLQGGSPVTLPANTSPSGLNFASGASVVYNPVTGNYDVTVTATAAAGQITNTLANGLNSNVTATQPTLRIGGPTGAFSIGGFAPASSWIGGQQLVVVNATSQTMTIVHLDSSSSASNRIDCRRNGANFTMPLGPGSTASFVYDGTASTWVLSGVVPSLAKEVDCRDFGVVADGIADDTTALQSALTAGAAMGIPIRVPYTNPGSSAISVTGATNASPIVVAATGHGLTTGQLVWTTGILGNLAANGYFVCTVVDSNHVSLNGTTGSGAYTSGGAIQWVAGIKVTSPLTVKPNMRVLGAGSTYISGYALSPTTIYDARVGASTPLITFTPDSGSPVGPTSRGCYFEGIAFICPDSSRTNYSFIVNGSTGLTFHDCHFQGAEIPGGSDPGMWRLLAFEGVSFIRCTFQWGFTHISCQGSGAGGPLKFDRCWFYDCYGPWISTDSNGDHDYTLTGCAFDSLYRLTVPSVGVKLQCNGFTIGNCSFNGILSTVPTGSYVQVGGVGRFVANDVHTITSVGLNVNGGAVEVSNNAFNCYTCVTVSGGATVTGGGNVYTPSQQADIPGNLFPFDAKRAVVVNEPYSGACQIAVGPDQIANNGGTYFFLESYHVGGSPSVGYVTGATSSGGLIKIKTQQAHGLTTGAIVDIEGVVGTTEANALGWTVTVTDTTHFTLNGSTFSNAYVSGGRCQYHAFANTLQYTTGLISYGKAQDASTNGPVLGGVVQLCNIGGGQQLPLATGTVLGPTQQAPSYVTNELYNGGVSYTLPPIVAGMVYEFRKTYDNASSSTTPSMVIHADPTDIALGFGQIMVPGIKNGASQIGEYGDATFNSRIRLKAVYWYDTVTSADVKRWVIDDAQGEWLSLDWTPSQLTDSTCVLYLDSMLGVTPVSGAVSQWVDQVASYTLTQSTAGQRPSINTADAAFNGLNSFSLANASSQHLTAGGSLAISQPATWYVVGYGTAAVSNNGFFTMGAGNMAMYSNAGASGTLGLYAGSAQGGETIITAASADVICGVFNGVKSQGFVNTPSRETYELFNQNVGSGNGGTLVVGADGSTLNYMTGKLACILAFSGAHNEAQRTQVMRWLGAKYGVKIVTGKP